MLRIELIFFCFFLFILSVAVDVDAFKTTVKSSHIIPKKEKSLKVVWKEQGNKILHDSVCYNYTDGDIQYRQCRQQARQLFRDRCAQYEDKYTQTKYPYDDEYKKMMEKYCRSAAIYWP